jgi:hypothetical protein
MLVAIPLLALGTCLLAATFRGTLPTWIMDPSAVRLAASLFVFVSALIYQPESARG